MKRCGKTYTRCYGGIECPWLFKIDLVSAGTIHVREVTGYELQSCHERVGRVRDPLAARAVPYDGGLARPAIDGHRFLYQPRLRQ